MKTTLIDKEIPENIQEISNFVLASIFGISGEDGWTEHDLFLLLTTINSRIILALTQRFNGAREFQKMLALNILVAHIPTTEKNEAALAEFNRLIAALGDN